MTLEEAVEVAKRVERDGAYSKISEALREIYREYVRCEAKDNEELTR